MSSLLDDVSAVNDNNDQPCPCPLERDCTNRYTQLRRVLTLIDLMAPLRRAHSTHELHMLLNEKTGARWHFRTVNRDLQMLVEQGLADREYRSDFAPHGTKMPMWKLNLRSSEPVQEAAIKVLDGPTESATQPTKTWTVHIVNLVTNESEVLWQGLTKKGVLMRMKLWRERRTDCILLPFPNFLPPPDFLPPRVQNEPESPIVPSVHGRIQNHSPWENKV